MGNALHQAVLQACRNFMIPIARFLLRNGVTFREFAEVAKWAFVQVASEEYGIRGRKTNISRVSVMTGLSRKDVTSFRNQPLEESDLEKEWRVASDALRAWHTQDRFLSSVGLPKPLRYSEGESSFSSLVMSLQGGYKPQRVRDLLLESNAIRLEIDGSLNATTRYYMPAHSDLGAVHHFGEAVRNLAMTIESNYSETHRPTKFERFVWSDSLPPTATARFQRILAENATKTLELFDDWLTAHEEHVCESAKVGVGIYYFDTSDARLRPPATNE